MPDDLVVLDGSTFFVTDRLGDVASILEPRGFFFADVRHLSVWKLLIDGQPLQLLSSGSVDYYSARVFATAGSLRIGSEAQIAIQRDRFVSDGCHEDILVENLGETKCQLELEVRFDADFAD